MEVITFYKYCNLICGFCTEKRKKVMETSLFLSYFFDNCFISIVSSLKQNWKKINVKFIEIHPFYFHWCDVFSFELLLIVIIIGWFNSFWVLLSAFLRWGNRFWAVKSQDFYKWERWNLVPSVSEHKSLFLY